MAAVDTPQRHEDELDRLDRQLEELLAETRVVMPGVQVLFAFLLAVPFTGRWSDASGFQEGAYFVTLLCAAVATALLIAPTAFHRVAPARREAGGSVGRRQEVIDRGREQLKAGLAFLAASMCGAIVLVTDELFGPAITIATGAIALAVFGWLWFGAGLLGKRRA